MAKLEVKVQKQFLERSAQMERTLRHQVAQELLQLQLSTAATVATVPTEMLDQQEPTEPTEPQVLQVQPEMLEAQVETAEVVLTVQLVAMVRLVW